MAFNKNQIAMFNNAAFSAGTISTMEKIHPTTERLYLAARKLRDVTGQSAVARLLDISPQSMLNWEKRGVSEGGALKAQKRIGCDANWVLSGDQQPMEADTWTPPTNTPTLPAIYDKGGTYLLARAWPFDGIDHKKVLALDPLDISRLEGALLLAAGQMCLDIAIATKSTRAQG